jgi:hypothetical protein
MLGGRLDALRRPLVHRLPQRALHWFGRQRIAELLAAALRVHVAGIRMLMA